MESTFKGKNLLLKEQILSYRSLPPLTSETKYSRDASSVCPFVCLSTDYGWCLVSATPPTVFGQSF